MSEYGIASLQCKRYSNILFKNSRIASILLHFTCVMLVMSKELLLISNILTEIAQLKNLNQAQYCTCICWLLARKVGVFETQLSEFTQE